MTEETIETTGRAPFKHKDTHGANAGFGTAMIFVGLGITAWGLFYDPSIPTTSAGYSGYGIDIPGMTTNVVNIGKATEKVMIFTGGIGVVLMGMVLRGTALILDWVRESTMRQRYQMEAGQ
jgi:hypothetical protein